MSRYDEAIGMARDHAMRVSESPDNWAGYLNTAAKMYQYTFMDALMIHAQKPNATICAELPAWNDKMNRWVNRGAKGIALIDRRGGRRSVRYVFDMSDTHAVRGARNPVQWQIGEEQEKRLLSHLKSIYHLTEKESAELPEALFAIASEMAARVIDETYKRIEERYPGFAGAGRDAENDRLFDLMESSMAYVLFRRCGLNPKDYMDEDEFAHVSEYGQPNMIATIGQEVQKAAREVLRDIGETVLRIQREDQQKVVEFRFRREELENGRDGVRKERGLPVPGEQRSIGKGARTGEDRSEVGDERDGGDAAGQVRQDEGDISGGERGQLVSGDADQRGAGLVSGEYRADSGEEDGRVDGGSDSEVSGSEQDGHDGVDGAYERSEGDGRGDGQRGTDLQVEDSEDGSEQAVREMSVDGSEDSSSLPTVASLGMTERGNTDDSLGMTKDGDTEDSIGMTKDGDTEASLGMTKGDDTEASLGMTERGDTDTSHGMKNEIDTDDLVGVALSLPVLASVEVQRREIEERVTALYAGRLTIDSEVVDEILRDGSNRDNGVLRIIFDFMLEQPEETHTQFVKNEYGVGGKGLVINGQEYSAWFDENGMEIASGSSVHDNLLSKVYLSWDEVSGRIHQLLKQGEYVPQEMLDQALENALQESALALCYMVDDFSSNELKEQYFSEYALYDGIYPDKVDRIAEKLKDDGFLHSIISELSMLEEGLAEAPTILRFKWHRPDELMSQLSRLGVEAVPFQAREDFSYQKPNVFVTQDEIDAFLVRNTVYSGQNRSEVYAYFCQHDAVGERAKFMKSRYGIAGGSSMALPNYRYFSYSYDGKGIVLEKDEPGVPEYRNLLRWNDVAKRIGVLIDENRYLTAEEVAKLPEFEREKIAEMVVKFYVYLPKNNERPFTENDEVTYGEVLDEIALKLAIPVEAERLYGRMFNDLKEVLLETDDQLAEDRLDILQTVRKYLDGKYSIFRRESPDEEIEMDSDIGDGVQEKEPKPMQLSIFDYMDAKEVEEPVVHLESVVIDLSPGSVQERDDNGGHNDHREEVGESGRADREMSIGGSEDSSSLPPVASLGMTKEDSIGVAEKDVSVISGGISELVEPVYSYEERINFRITDDELGAGGQKQKYHNNMEAIMCLKQIEMEHRLATPEEQEILSKYVGWGGISQAFDERNGQWKAEYEALKAVLTPDEYRAARRSSLNAFYTSPTVIRAMYEALSKMGLSEGNVLEPSCGIGNFMGMLPESMQAVNMYGVELDSLTGRIAQQLYQKNHIAVQGFEKTELPDNFFDTIIGNVPFGDYQVVDPNYDRHHFMIHDYFIARSIDLVRPGGVIAVVTSSGTMDKKDDSARRYFAQRADLLGAIRLPNTAFKRNANTEVVADILFFQKRDRAMLEEPEWVHSVDVEVLADHTLIRTDRSEDSSSLPTVASLGMTQGEEAGTSVGMVNEEATNTSIAHINPYFVEHPEMVLGECTMDSKQFGRMELTVIPYAAKELSELLSEAVAKIEGEIPEIEVPNIGEDAEERDISIPADPDVHNFSYTVVDDKVYFRENSRMFLQELPVKTTERVKGMVAIRDMTRALLQAQLNDGSDIQISAMQMELNELYDAFVKRNGLISSTANKRAFSQDSGYCLISALEVIDENGELERKADIFTKRTIRKAEAVTSVDTASEALAVSIGEKAGIDLAYMAELTGKSEDAIVEELKGVIFKNPVTGKYETADEYLSGNVREKLRIAKVFAGVEEDRSVLAAREMPVDGSEDSSSLPTVASLGMTHRGNTDAFLGMTTENDVVNSRSTTKEDDTEDSLGMTEGDGTVASLGMTYEVNVEALERVQPKDLDASEIEVRLGAPWVKVEYIQEFMEETFETPAYLRQRETVKIHYASVTGVWGITAKTADRSPKVTSTYGTGRANAYRLLEDSLNLKDTKIYDTVEEDGKEKRVLNKKETMLAQQKQEMIKEAFKNWIFRDIERREDLCRTYNELFNSIRPREYDGSHIRFVGMNPEIVLKEHQRNAIAHVLYGHNTLLASGRERRSRWRQRRWNRSGWGCAGKACSSYRTT